jgi:hypothetical protein
LITACAHRPPDPPASSSAQVIHYRGTSEVRSPDGKQLETMRLLLRRTLDPTHDLITEQIAQKTSRPEEAPREYIMSLKVSGSQFVITEPVTGLAGGGELYGDPWQWSSWSSRAQLPDGSRLESAFVLNASGLKAEKRFFNSNGKITAMLIESYQPISPDAFERERAQLLAP